jgi:hypothetical protein
MRAASIVLFVADMLCIQQLQSDFFETAREIDILHMQ